MTLHVPNGRSGPVCASSGFLSVAYVTSDDPIPETTMRAQLGNTDFAHLFVFAQSKAALQKLVAAARKVYPDTMVSGCTTAGQIGAQGFETEREMVLGLPARNFATRSVLIEDLHRLDPDTLVDSLAQTRVSLETERPEFSNGFGFMLMDGLSLREDEVTGHIAKAMGAWPLFGGSAADGVRFKQTLLVHDGLTYKNAGLVTFVSTDCETAVFSLNHLQPTEMRMVVTLADPARRIVKEINAEPAAREYARIIGKDPDQLDEFTFAAHPIVVRLGDTHHVRAIQRVNKNGELVFFSAIDEGMVLTVAQARDMASHLDERLSQIRQRSRRFEVLACDCLLRRIEAEQTQTTYQVSQVLKRHNVLGFSTYGEQIGPLHINHTMTGVALMAPPEASHE